MIDDNSFYLELLRTYIDSANDAIFVLCDEMKFLLCNKLSEKWLGLTESVLTRHNHRVVITEYLGLPENKAMFQKCFSSVLQGHPHKFCCEIHPDKGKPRWVEMNINKVALEAGAMVIVVARDISEQKQSEQKQVEKGLSLLRNLINQVNDSIYVVDPVTSRFLNVNCMTCSSLGYTREELLTMGVFDIDSGLPDSFSWSEHVRDIRDGGPVVLETRHRCKDGSVLPVEVNVQSVMLDQNEYLIAVVRDLTERKKVEEELLRAQKLESVSLLAGGIAHDFNNLLTSIMGNIDIALAHSDPDSFAFERIEKARKACRSAKGLTHQLLTFSKGGAPVKTVVIIRTLIQDAVQLSLTGSNVGCEFDFDDRIFPVEVDVTQMTQVMNNVVMNGDQAMPEGGVISIRVRNVTVDPANGLALHPGSYVKISVKDHGIGIPAENLNRVFDPYFTTKDLGSGLGLATCYSIIRKHAGIITVDSKPGTGTIFDIYLPATKNTVKESQTGPVQSLRGCGKILVMDDDEMIRNMASRLLSELGYKTVLSKDGAELLEIYLQARYSESPFDAVIMDLTIPGGMGGKEAMQKLLELDPHVKAIVSSGYSEDAVLTDFKSYGFIGMLSKPYSSRELGQILHQVLQNHSKV